MKLNNKGATTKNEKILLIVLGVLSISALCYLLIITPAQKKWKPIVDNIKIVEKQLEEVKNIDNEIANLNIKLDKLMVEYDAATAGLPKTDRYPEVFRDIEQLAVDCGLTSIKGAFYEPELVKMAENSKDTKSSDDSKFKGMKTLQVDYFVNNDVEKVLNFIDKLENDQRIADIGQVKQTEDYIMIKIYFYEAGEKEKEVYDFN